MFRATFLFVLFTLTFLLRNKANGQTKEHAMLAKALGVNQILVVVNKLDATDPPWSEERYRAVKDVVGPFLTRTGFKPKKVTPRSLSCSRWALSRFCLGLADYVEDSNKWAHIRLSTRHHDASLSAVHADGSVLCNGRSKKRTHTHTHTHALLTPFGTPVLDPHLTTSHNIGVVFQHLARCLPRAGVSLWWWWGTFNTNVNRGFLSSTDTCGYLPLLEEDLHN